MQLFKVVLAIVCAVLSMQSSAQGCPWTACARLFMRLLFVHVTVAALRWCMLDQALVSLTAVTLTRDGTADQTYLKQHNWSLSTC